MKRTIISILIAMISFVWYIDIMAIDWYRTLLHDGYLVGRTSTIGIDKKACPHIIYYKSYQVRHVYQDTARNWHNETVTSSSLGGFGRHSLDFDSKNQIHISFHHTDVYSYDALKYAYKDNSGWHIETIDNGIIYVTTIKIDKNDFPHIVYCIESNTLKYAFKDESGWHIQTVATNANEGTRSHKMFDFDKYGRPCVTYLKYSGNNNDLMFAWLEGTTWKYETIVTNLGRDAGSYAGASIEIDKNNYVHIVYNTRYNRAVKYVYQDSIGWNYTTIASVKDYGAYPCIDLDDQNYPHVCYFNEIRTNEGYYNYAYKNSEGWHIETASRSSENTYSNRHWGYSAIALNENNEPHISYYGFGLRFARPQDYGPDPFSLISPENGSWASPTPTLKWKASSYNGLDLSGYEVWIDNAPYQLNIPPYRVSTTLSTPLSNGWHTWKVRAVLSVGGDIWSTESWSIGVDATPPASFDLLSPANNFWTINTQPLLNWQASSDVGSGLLKYQLFLNGLLSKDDIPPSETSTNPLWSLTDGAYEWYIIAMDNARYETQSNQTWTLTIDTTPPNSFYLLSPANNSWTGDVTPTFSWDSTTDDGIGLSKYQLTIDGNVVVDSIRSDITSVTLTPSQSLLEGSRSWKIKAYDLLGNAQETSSRILRIDLTPPIQFSLSSPSDSGLVNFPTPNFSWSATTDGGSGLSHYQLWIDGNLNIDGLTTTATATSTPLTEGYHNWFVKAIDNVGNERSTEQWTVICEWNPPLPFNLVSPIDGDTVITSKPLFCWERAEDPGSGIDRYQLWIDDNINKDNIPATDTCSAPTNDLSIGNHSWFVKAFDKANNERVSNSVWYFTIETGCLLGDVNMDEAITPGDALCAFQIYLNGGTPSPGECDNECALYSADANCDGSITPGDALVIFQAYLNGLTPPLECPPGTELTTAKITNELKLSLPEVDSAPGEEVTVSIKLSNPLGLRAFGLDLGYPIELLSFFKVSSTNLTKGWKVLDGQENSQGVITIGGFNPEAISSTKPEALVTLTFKVKDAVEGYGDIWLFNLTDDVSEAEINSGGFGTIVNGVRMIGGVEIPTTYSLEQNYPNPFNMETEIQYQLPEAGYVYLSIYNSLGQKIRTLVSRNQVAGRYATRWDGRDEQGRDVTSGIYICKLATPRFSGVKKMMLIK